MIKLGLESHQIILFAFAILFNLTLHEFMHAWTAMKLGDDTAYHLGRVTLNPIYHLDFMGTVAFLFLPLGWGKPVPVNLYNTKNPRKADFLISIAGPMANIAICIASCLLIRILLRFMPEELHNNPSLYLLSKYTSVDIKIKVISVAISTLVFMATIGIGLAFFNLIPLFPLDGSHILSSIIPLRYVHKLNNIQKYGPMILIALLWLPGLNIIFFQYIRFAQIILYRGLLFGENLDLLFTIKRLVL